MNIELTGKRVFISAGAAGIGRSTALAMHKIGAQVQVCDIDQAALDSLPAGITRYVCDVTNESDVIDTMKKVTENGIDVLINNAGVSGPTKPIEEITGDEWQQCINGSLSAPFYFTRAVVPFFKKQAGGVIINLISAGGVMGYPNRTPYAAAKWGVTGLVKTLAMELGPHNIRVNGIVPGNVSGDRFDRVVTAHAKADGITEAEVHRIYLSGTSMQCYVDPQEVADMICFLCSDHSRHVSGQVIAIDGNTETLYPRL